MRALGASRRQVVVTIAAEAFAIGVLATAIGFAAGVGIASVLQSVMESGLELPAADLVINAGAIVASAIDRHRHDARRQRRACDQGVSCATAGSTARRRRRPLRRRPCGAP